MVDRNMEELLNCALCPNICRCECPVTRAIAREKVTPAGKARLAVMLEKEQLDWDSDLLEAVSSCLGCRGCTTLCPFPDLVLCEELVQSINKAGSLGVSLNETSPYLGNLKKYSSPYGLKQKNSFQQPGKAEVVFYTGCTALANNPESIAATRALLDEANVSYTMIEEDCCGYPADVWGDQKLARQLAGENKMKLEKTGASVVLTGCPECWHTFTVRYPDWNQELSQEVIDVPTFLLKLVEDKRLKPVKPVLNKVSYHDPCLWARVAGKTEEPRKLLKSIPGLTIDEPYCSGEKTRCCGGGHMFQLSFPRVADSVAKERLSEFSDHIPIITSCPFCLEGLKSDQHRVIDISVAMMEACNLEPVSYENEVNK